MRQSIHAGASSYTWKNLPVAVALIAVLSYVSGSMLDVAGNNAASGISTRANSVESANRSPQEAPIDPRPLQKNGNQGDYPYGWAGSRQPPLTDRDRAAWQHQVGSKLVEFAWDKLCGSLVQQVGEWSIPSTTVYPIRAWLLFWGFKFVYTFHFCCPYSGSTIHGMRP